MNYKKLFKKMSQAKIVNLTKRMPFVSMILIAIDLAIVYRVFMESGAEAGSFVTGRWISIEGYIKGFC